MARRIAGKTKKPKRTRKPKRKVSRRVKKTARAKKISEVLSSTYSAPKSKPKRTRKPKSKPKSKSKSKSKGKMTYRSFVKKNFKGVQDEMPSGTPAPQIIKRIASLWKKQKTKEQSAWRP